MMTTDKQQMREQIEKLLKRNQELEDAVEKAFRQLDVRGNIENDPYISAAWQMLKAVI